MQRIHIVAAQAARVRRLLNDLDQITTALHEAHAGDLAMKCFDLELHAGELHLELVEALANPTRPPLKHHPAYGSEQLPF